MKTMMALCVALLLGGCLEHEEETTVHPDGSISMRLRAHGGLADVATGYPLPLHGPWQPTTEQTRRWIATLGSDTGSSAVRANVRNGLWQDNGGSPAKKADLEVVGQFASVDAIPRWSAPDDEPYRTAFMGRSATLRIERKGNRTIYTYERTYHGRHHAGWDYWQDLLAQVRASAGDDLGKASDDALRKTAEIGAKGAAEYGESFVRASLAPIYTEGDASLSASAMQRVLAMTRASVRRAVPATELLAALTRWREKERAKKDSDKDVKKENEGQTIEAWNRAWRRAIRDSLAEGLTQEGVTEPVSNAVRGRLEWTFAAFDCTGDLEQEKFRVTTHMPGVIVWGNYNRVRGGTATWEFKGADMKGKDIVMRVVSVKE